MMVVLRSRIVFVCALFSLNLGAQQINFKNYSLANGLPQSNVTDAVQDNIGYLWFATQGGGIARFDGENFKVFSQNNGLISNYINTLHLKNDSLYIGTNSGLSIKVNDRFQNFTSPKINKILSFNKKLYLATDEGLYLVNKGYIVPIKINLIIDLASIENIIYQNSFFWVKSKKQAWKLNRLNQHATITKISLRDYEKIKEKNILLNAVNLDKSLQSITNKIILDVQNNIWLLTNGKGVYKSTSFNLQHYTTFQNRKISKILAVHYGFGKIWFVDTNNNLYAFDEITKKISWIRKNNFITTTITSDGNDNVWLGSEKKGIFILTDVANDNQNYKVIQLNTKNGLPNNNVLNLHIGKETVWVVTKEIGILKLDYNFEKGFVKNISRFNNSNGIKELSLSTSLLANNALWYATHTGSLGKIENDVVSHYSRLFQENVSISALAIYKNNLYLSTLGSGIFKINTQQKNQIKQLNTAFLNSKNCYQILFDEKGNLWVGSEKGMDKLSFKKEAIIKSTHFNTNDGFEGGEASKNSSVKDDEGNLWFGTHLGLIKYTPTNNNKESKVPKISFEHIEVNYQSINRLNLKKEKNILQLNPNQNHFSITYKTVDVNHPKEVEYQWTLNGNSSSWTTRNTINFINAKAGNNTFSVKSRSANKTESNPIQLQFFIDKPLHKKGWFQLLLLSIVLLVTLLLIYSYFRYIKRKNKATIEKLSLENHLITLEQKALQLQMNPHFIFNILHGIKAMNKKGNTQDLDQTINQFSLLMRSVLQNSRLEEISLEEEITTIKNYLDLEIKMSQIGFSYSLEHELQSIHPEEILIPSMIVQPFIENSIKHGFKGNHKKWKIAIIFKVVNEQLIGVIEDNGVGFNNTSSSSNTHKSIAITVTKERIENISKNSTLEINEITKNSKVLGTRVRISIPLKTDF